MRGKERAANPDVAALGITPAHAGKSLHGLVKGKTTRDHPRACGEKGLLEPFRHFK